MARVDQAEIVRRWRELALRRNKTDPEKDVVAWALVIAEIVGREADLSEAFKQINVKDSRIAQRWEDQGIEKGMAKGKLVGQIQLCQEMLKQPLTPERELAALPEQELAALLAELRQQVLPNGA